jgi:hypothetical protein
MPYMKTGRLVRRVKKAIKKRQAKHREAVRQAKAVSRKVEKAQAEVVKSSRVRAGDLVGSGDWKWEGSGMSPDTIVEPVLVDGRWEYVPAKVQPRKAALANDPESAPAQCRGRTKDGSPCQRIGNCPVKSHKRNKV